MAVYFCELCNVNHAVGSGCPKDIPYCDVCHQPTNQAPTTFEEPTHYFRCDVCRKVVCVDCICFVATDATNCLCKDCCDCCPGESISDSSDECSSSSVSFSKSYMEEYDCDEFPSKFAFSTTFINSMILVLSGAAVVLWLLIYFK